MIKHKFKLNNKIIILLILFIVYLITTLIYSKLTHYNKKIDIDELSTSNQLIANQLLSDSSNIIISKSKEIMDKVVYDNTVGKIVWDGLNRQQLIDKLNRVLNSTIAGQGEVFADYCIEHNMDPYLAVAIVMQETGCAWNCSYLVNACYNVGGQKGSPGCDGGAYKAFNSLDEGIRGFLDNLYYNYYAYGLTTPEAINPKYAESSSWAYNVNSYINKIRAA